MLQCGMSETDITPWLGLEIPGYLSIRNATGVKDKLFAKAVVFCNNDQTTGIVAIDALDLEREDVLRIRARANYLTGIPMENIMVCLTHTHTGGPVVNCFVTKRNETYIDFLVNKAADAISLAYENLVPAKVGSGNGMVGHIAFNRRYVMQDGSVKTNPGRMNPLIVKPVGPIDPDVMIMKIQDANDKLIGAIINFACHLDVVGGSEYCADYAGELSKILKSVYGKDFCCIFLTGLSGNINHIDTKGTLSRSSHYKKMGEVLAGETIKPMPFITCCEDVLVGARSKLLNMPLRTVQEEDVQKARQLVAQGDDQSNEKIFAQELLVFCQYQSKTTNVEVQVLKVGDMVFTGFPGDVFVEFGLRIKQGAPNQAHFISSHANGRNGYIPVREAFSQGGYEVRTTRSNKLHHAAGDEITATALEMINYFQ